MTTTLPIALSNPLTPARQTALINLIRRAARTEILPRFRNLTARDIATKSGPQDLVTEADTQTEAMIARGLAQMFPGALIVGEEASVAHPELRDAAAEAELAFIIDPVDGTWNFAHGLGVFGVILAATRFGRPVFGLIYDPLADDYILAAQDGPARHISASGRETVLHLAPAGGIDTLSGHVHLSLMPKAQQHVVAPLLPLFRRTGTLRCSAHEYRQAAQGTVDFVLSSMLNPWDHAAGVLICQRAGGTSKMLDGSDYTMATRRGHLLTAPDAATWDALRDIFAALLPAAATPVAAPEAEKTT